MDTLEIKHHITGKVIRGYGIQHLKQAYNVYTMTQTKERDSKHFIPNDCTSVINIKEYFDKINTIVENKEVEFKPATHGASEKVSEEIRRVSEENEKESLLKKTIKSFHGKKSKK